MSRRSHRELWEQLKVLILCGSKRRYSQKELYEVMVDMELMQLSQDPMNELLKPLGVKK